MKMIITTDEDEIKDVQTLKTVAPPSTAQTAGANELIFGLVLHQVNTNGATMAIFKFPSRT